LSAVKRADIREPNGTQKRVRLASWFGAQPWSHATPCRDKSKTGLVQFHPYQGFISFLEAESVLVAAANVSAMRAAQLIRPSCKLWSNDGSSQRSLIVE
jgi:hypothetical protein